jgi:hypothetical protein
MKLKIPHPSPAMAIALVALFIALGGTAFAFSNGRSSTADRAGARGKLTLRFGKLVDKDSTPFDGSFFFAIGHAICKKGERVIAGGVREINNSGSDGQHIWMVESGPVPKKRGWYVQMNSDLGGAARKDFLVVATCERK